jgi:hypothetical protein
MWGSSPAFALCLDRASASRVHPARKFRKAASKTEGGLFVLSHPPKTRSLPGSPELIGVGASLGFLIAFLLLFSLMRGNRRRWMEHAARESLESR